MDMSKACSAPIQPPINAKDRAHPLFTLYSQYRTFCNVKMIQADSFANWLYQYDQELLTQAASLNPAYPAFKAWMIGNQGGARKCPAGNFPHNMHYWIAGGRW